jgi:hypothetical protein
MATTRPPRPALLTATAVASLLIGGAGVVSYGGSLLSLVPLFLSGFALDALTLLALVPSTGSFLITLTTLRWGIAVLRRRPTMAYFPGRTARTGRYGAVTGVLMILASLPLAYVLFAFGLLALDSASPFALLYAAFVADAVGMIAFAGRLNRESAAA